MDAKEQLRDAAERLALTLAQGGMQKTTARVMTALLYTEQDTMTAADLCEELSISSGAVSTAIKQLIPVGLVERVPAPGSRRDHYRFREGAWATLMSQQNTMLNVMLHAAQEGIDATGDGTPTARRLREMQDFYTFMARELPAQIESWRKQYQG
ncbi:GbsR/MarR family transcriptional regulator [Streptomyces regalis]|uniref:MarR family transcriptional regulator n=1 Tax=Streptomyces regalis TaxID=68262 RepID=A0A0X3VDG9_9ACTN|nr:MarR family transcriptional regulator [Streptomyces regalis]KUL42819.1 MarR family transcriptional regulator [Streptomyces regalis]